MWALDNPKRARFVRDGIDGPSIAKSKARAGWVNVLRGAALDDFLGRVKPSQAVLDRLRMTGGIRQMAVRPMKPGKPGRAERKV